MNIDLRQKNIETRLNNLILPRKNNLRLKRDIQNVFSKGRKYHSNLISVAFHNRNDNQISRFALLVGKKVDKRAVTRNTVKRRLREIVRIEKKGFKLGFDVVIITRRGIEKMKYSKIKTELFSLLAKAGILQKSEISNQ